MLIQDAATQFISYKKGSVSPSTIHTYEYRLKFLEVFLRDTFGIHEVEEIVLHHLHENYAWKSHNIAHITTKMFMQWLRHRKYIDDDFYSDPYNNLRMPPQPRREPEPISIEAAKMMIIAALEDMKEPILGLRDAAIMYTLLYTGVRRKELLGFCELTM